jgi:membrane protein YdbS with pleckstrin-like domain
VTSVPDAPLPFSALEQRVLDVLMVPSAPEVPEGSSGSLRIFRAGEKFYAWLVFIWAVKGTLLCLPLIGATLGVLQATQAARPWVAMLLLAGIVLFWSIFIFGLVVTFLAQRLNFRLRWYIVTDRSLRVRSGVFGIRELTMTYRNIQEIRVTAGPIQNALGLATVEVHAAGGGGGDPRHGGGRGHVARLEGLSNATEIRDLIVERLRQYRDSGLGESPQLDAPRPVALHDETALSAAREVLAEVRALRGAIG